MTQQHIHYRFDDDASRQDAIKTLSSKGFAVHESPRGGIGLIVRVRKESNDESTVVTLMSSVRAERGPNGTPVTHIAGYRDGFQ